MRKSKFNPLGLSIVEDKAKLFHKHDKDLKEINLDKPEAYRHSNDFSFIVEPVNVEVKGKLKRDTRVETVLVDCLKVWHFDDKGDIEIITASLEHFIIQ